MGDSISVVWSRTRSLLPRSEDQCLALLASENFYYFSCLMDASLHSGQQNSFGCSGVSGIGGVGAGSAAPAGAIAKTRIRKDLVASVASLSEEY